MKDQLPNVTISPFSDDYNNPTLKTVSPSHEPLTLPQIMDIHGLYSDIQPPTLASIKPKEMKSFLVKIKEVLKPAIWNGVKPTEVVKYRTLTIQSTSFTAARELVVSKGFTLAD